MLRILIYLIAIVLVAAGITWLGALQGFTQMRVGDTLIDVHSGLLLGLLVTAAVLIAVATLIASGLARLPSNIRRKAAETRRSKGMIALTRGLEAVAAGDAADAQRNARLASRNLEEPGVTRLLTAQAAQLAGDEETAQAAFSAMLEAPETEFLGLRGLYLQAMSRGDRKEAREYADRAFRLRPGAEWAYQSVYSLSIDRGAWGDAREALRLAQQNGLEEGEAARRREAALLTAGAYAARNAGDNDSAVKDAETALKKSAGFAPAAVLAAQIEAAAGRRSRAGRILDDAWSVAPHPAIAKTMADLYADETVERRAARLKKLAERRPDADESKLLIAEQDIALGEYATARDTLEDVLTRQPRARAFAAMAAAVDGLSGRDAAQVWLDRAAAAPLDPVPGADGVFHFTTDGWQRLIREFGDHGRMAPPPLEEIQTGLSREEIRLLSAPAAPEPAVEEIEVESEEVTDAPSEDIADQEESLWSSEPAQNESDASADDRDVEPEAKKPEDAEETEREPTVVFGPSAAEAGDDEPPSAASSQEKAQDKKVSGGGLR